MKLSNIFLGLVVFMFVIVGGFTIFVDMAEDYHYDPSNTSISEPFDKFSYVRNQTTESHKSLINSTAKTGTLYTLWDWFTGAPKVIISYAQLITTPKTFVEEASSIMQLNKVVIDLLVISLILITVFAIVSLLSKFKA